MSKFFPYVVKNVIVKSVELKKLVYMFLTHYADSSAECRELALLSINSFQKDMTDKNPVSRVGRTPYTHQSSKMANLTWHSICGLCGAFSIGVR